MVCVMIPNIFYSPFGVCVTAGPTSNIDQVIVTICYTLTIQFYSKLNVKNYGKKLFLFRLFLIEYKLLFTNLT